MKNLIKLIVFFLAISNYSCQNHSGYVITGNLTGFPDSTMLYLTNLSTDETFDSTKIIGGKYQFRGQLLDEPEQIRLNTVVDNKAIYVDLLIGNEKIRLEGDISDFPWSVKISGSKTQDEENNLRDLTKSYYIKRFSLVQGFFKLSPEMQQKKSKEIWSEIQTIDDTILALRVGYIKSNINTYAGIIDLGYLKTSLPKDTIQALFNKLSDEKKASKYAKIIEVFLNEKISEIGDSYHDFKALNKDGDTIIFSKLIGKYILLDFTAAYCLPCKLSAEELRLINRKYSDSLRIVSFYGDLKKDSWLESLQRDSVSWISLWDGKGRYSETCIKYGAQGTPTFLIIDPKGIIVDKWSGYEKGILESALKKYIKN